MIIPQALINAKNALQWEILALPGVTGISIGFLEQDDQIFDEVALRVIVKDLSQIPSGIPETLAGFNVCLIEADIQPCSLPDTARYTSVGGGIKIDSAVGSGTLGAVVKDADGTAWGLTCFHSVGLSSSPWLLRGGGVWQPKSPLFIEGQQPAEDDKLGEVKRWEFPRTQPLPFARERVSLIDAAIFSLDTAISLPIAHRRTVSPRIVGKNGDPSILIPRVTAKAHPDPGPKVIKRGFVTGETTGFIIGSNTTCQWKPGGSDTYLIEQYEIRGSSDNPGGQFCKEGDSGSLVILDNTQTALGLLYGGSPEGKTAIVNKIGNVESHLGVSVVWP